MSFLPDLIRWRRQLIDEFARLWLERERYWHQKLTDETLPLQQRILDLLNSKSWKLTAPIRWVDHQIRENELPHSGMANTSLKSEQSVDVGEFASRLLQEEAMNAWVCLSAAEMQTFLALPHQLALPSSESPELSIVVVMCNRAELTFECVRSIAAQQQLPATEVILINNGSADETERLLRKLSGPKIIHNSENIHFVRAANQACQTARGKYLLFLNNDVELLPHAIDASLRLIRSSDEIGAVGAKLVHREGSLQEAGSIIYSDGTTAAYGRGENPVSPAFQFQRDVDYCSAAFLLTRTKLFQETGGFHSDFEPAYYEDADYCLRLCSKGFRVLYNPASAAIHYEFASSQSASDAMNLQSRNKASFIRLHEAELSKQPAPNTNILSARSRRQFYKRILYIEERIPKQTLGAGYPRSIAILHSLERLNCFVTLFPTEHFNEEWDNVYSDIPAGVEVMIGYGPEQLESFLNERAGYYDLVLVSRPENLKLVRSILDRRGKAFVKALIYDAEAIFANRESGRENAISSEAELASCADQVLAVTEDEQQIFVSHGIQNVSVLPYAVKSEPGPAAFEDRGGILFVGAIHGDSTPNADAILWFVREIFPLIRKSRTFNLQSLDSMHRHR